MSLTHKRNDHAKWPEKNIIKTKNRQRESEKYDGIWNTRRTHDQTNKRSKYEISEMTSLLKITNFNCVFASIGR